MAETRDSQFKSLLTDAQEDPDAFNKYLEWELRMHPLVDRAWAADILLPRLDAVLGGEPDEQHALFTS